MNFEESYSGTYNPRGGAAAFVSGSYAVGAVWSFVEGKYLLGTILTIATAAGIIRSGRNLRKDFDRFYKDGIKKGRHLEKGGKLENLTY